jgi:drug/metabolite transporter (DMT)-like permease
MNRTQQIGVLFIFLSVLGYSFFPVFTRWLQDSGLSSPDIATWRFILAAPLFWLVVLVRRLPPSPHPLPRYRLLGMGSLLAIAALCALFGLEQIPVSTFIVLFYTYPAMVALISVLMGERLPVLAWVALGLTLVGIALTAPDFSAGLSGTNVAGGVILSLINAVVVAVYFLISSALLRGHTDMARASAWSVTGAFLIFVASMLFRQVSIPSQPGIWAILFAMAGLSTVFPIFFLNAGIQKLGATKASITGTIEPVVTIVWAVLLLGETIQGIQLVGGILVLISVILLQVRPTPQPSPALSAD